MKSTVKAFMVATLMLLACTGMSAQAQKISANHSAMEIIPEVSSVAPGQTFTLALQITSDKNWHNYWMNPGDAGKGVSINKWRSPKGVNAAALQYPTPHVVPFGEMITYAYASASTMLLDVTLPAELSGDSVSLAASVSWLVCDDQICVPERGMIDITLPIGDGAIDDSQTLRFLDARRKLPSLIDWPAAYHIDGDHVVFELAWPVADAEDIYLFPTATKLINAGAGQTAIVEDGLLKVTALKGMKADSRAFSTLVLTFTDGGGDTVALEFAASKVDSVGGISPAVTNNSSSASNQKELGFLSALLAALIGGLILNLMPCVLPVLSLKILSLAKMAKAHPRWVRESGVFYTIGVMTSFALMAMLIIGLKMAGETIGWGFQMQNPVVLLILVLLMTLIGLNLLGVFEFGAGLMSVGSEKTEGRSNKSSFWTGVLAVVVATPCTAPFMAGALGYAFVQSWYVTLLIFLSLGFGLALPYLLVAFVPRTRRFIPNPGAWMSVFKSALAFPMFGTAIWLLWVLGDKDAMVWALVSVLMLSIAAWAWGVVHKSAKPHVWKTVAIVAFVTMLVYPLQWTLEAKADAVDARKLGLVGGASRRGEAIYSEGLLMEKLAAGKSVFVYFTADWCITCKANEKGSLHSDTVKDYFRIHNIDVMVGDYTDYDDAITRMLSLYKRVGVPLYLYFVPSNKVGDAKVLPQTLLTPNSLLDEIKSS